MELWGVSIKAFFVQYRFILPKNTKHSAYLYQKLFRAIYGYTQNVTKANGKTYRYSRRGVLSTVPYLHDGKNCVVIPPSAFAELSAFFKTGKNPTHNWRTKGDWKAVYYLNEKNISEAEGTKAMEKLLDRTVVLTNSREQQALEEELASIADKGNQTEESEGGYIRALLREAETVVENDWFKECCGKSKRLTEFNNLIKEIKRSKDSN